MDNNQETFKLQFRTDWLHTGDTLNQGQLQVISESKGKYIHWTWRILEFFTAGKRFKARYEYTVKPIELKPIIMQGGLYGIRGKINI